MQQSDGYRLRGLWEDLGLGPGMVVMCHSFLPSLGRFIPGPEIVVDTLLEQISPSGTLVVPTFSYSYFQGEVYDVEKTPSLMGVLSEMVRSHPSAVRSLDPNFSMAAIGPAAETLMHRDILHSFGPASIYDKLMQADFRVLLLGVDYTALALFMHLEKIHAVRYRHDKTFTGTTSYQGRTFPDTAVHFVRDRVLNPVSDRNRIGALIDHEPECRKRAFGYGEHRFLPASTVAGVVAEQLSKDPFILIKNPVG